MKKVKYQFPRRIIDEEYSSRLRTKSINDIVELKGTDSLCDLFKRLSRMYALVVFIPYGLEDNECQTDRGFRRELTYAKDVRIDYVKHKMFIPVYRYKYRKNEKSCNFRDFSVNNEEYIQYSQLLTEMQIWRDGVFSQKTIDIVLRRNQDINIYRIDISVLPLYKTLSEVEYAETLYNKYIQALYKKGDIYEEFFYKSEKFNYINNKHKKLLRDNELYWYKLTNYSIFRYVRDYKQEELLDCDFTPEELGIELSDDERRIEFEGYFCQGLYQDIDWIDWTKGNFKDFKSGKYFFVKYKYNDVALVLLRDKIFL